MVRILKSIFDFYLNSSIHIGLAVCSFIWVTMLNFNVGVDLNFIYFTFFATITGYNFVKYFGLAKFYHRNLANWLKWIQIFSLLSFIAMLYFATFLSKNVLVYIAGLGLITFFYAVPFLPKKYLLDHRKNLRSISGIKTHIIAFVWAVTTVLVPLVNENYAFTFDVWITAIQRYIFVFVVMIPFDIYDMKNDNVKLSTIPQQIGLKRAKILGVLLTVVFYLLEYLKDELWDKNLMILAIISLLMIFALLFSFKEQSKYYSLFWVEAIPIVWAIIAIANY